MMREGCCTTVGSECEVWFEATRGKDRLIEFVRMPTLDHARPGMRGRRRSLALDPESHRDAHEEIACDNCLTHLAMVAQR